MHYGNCSIGRHVRNQNKQRSYGDKSKTLKNKLICDRTSPVLSSEPYPNFINKDSCTGTGSIQEQETTLERTQVMGKTTNLEWQTKLLGQKSRTPRHAKTPRDGPQSYRKCRSLVNKKLVEASETMSDKEIPKAYQNMMQGYKLWKEGYVSRVRVKPGITAGFVTLCLAKASVSASTERGIFAVFSFIAFFSL